MHDMAERGTVCEKESFFSRPSQLTKIGILVVADKKLKLLCFLKKGDVLLAGLNLWRDKCLNFVGQ